MSWLRFVPGLRISEQHIHNLEDKSEEESVSNKSDDSALISSTTIEDDVIGEMEIITEIIENEEKTKQTQQTQILENVTTPTSTENKEVPHTIIVIDDIEYKNEELKTMIEVIDFQPEVKALLLDKPYLINEELDKLEDEVIFDVTKEICEKNILTSIYYSMFHFSCKDCIRNILSKIL